MKNSPSAVAGGLFFCVRRDGEFRAPAASALFVSDGDNFAPAGGGWGVSCPGTSSFLSSLKESYQRKPLETTFQDFLGAGTAGANLTVCTRGRGAAVITVGQKDCACVHRRGGFRDRLPSHGRGICFYRVGDYQIAPLPPQGGKGRCARWART